MNRVFQLQRMRAISDVINSNYIVLVLYYVFDNNKNNKNNNFINILTS